MRKNHFLRLLISMLVAMSMLISTIGIQAETTDVEDEICLSEAVETVYEEQPEFELGEDDSSDEYVEGEITNEIIEVLPEEQFEGYIALPEGTAVFSDVDLTEEFAKLSSNSIVYAATVESLDKGWNLYQIIFDTVDSEGLVCYVKAADGIWESDVIAGRLWEDISITTVSLDYSTSEEDLIELPAEQTEETPESETPAEQTEETVEPEVPTEQTEETAEPEAPAEQTEETVESEAPAEQTEETVESEAPAEQTEETAEPEAPAEQTEETAEPEAPAEQTEETAESETPTEEEDAADESGNSDEDSESEMTATAVDEQTVQYVWYFHEIVNEPMEIHVGTTPDAHYLHIYLNGNQIACYSEDEAEITESANGKEWFVRESFEYAGKALLSYRTSADGSTVGPEFNQETMIEQPPIVESWYDSSTAFANTPYTIHVTTNKAVEELQWPDGNKTWTVEDAQEIIEYPTSKEWVIKHTFDYPGRYELWFKAKDNNGESNFYQLPDVQVEWAPIIDVWYYPNPGIEGSDLQINVITRLDEQYLYVHIGDTELVYTADEVNPVVEGESKTWTVTPDNEDLRYAGTMNLGYQVSTDGNERSAWFNAPIVVDRKPIIYMWAEEATEGSPVVFHFATNLKMNHLHMFMGEDEAMIQEWTEENSTIESFETYKEWTTSYTFEGNGTMSVWFKASEDGVTMSNAYNFEETNPIIVKPATETIEIDDVMYQVIEGGVKISQYNGSASNVIIPETVLFEEEELSVIEVGAGAFENNASLVSIDLPDTITIIGARAFANCTSLSIMN